MNVLIVSKGKLYPVFSISTQTDMLSLNKMFAFIIMCLFFFLVLLHWVGPPYNSEKKKKNKCCEQKPLPFSQMQEGNIQILAIKYDIRCRLFIGSVCQVEEIPFQF